MMRSSTIGGLTLLVASCSSPVYPDAGGPDGTSGDVAAVDSGSLAGEVSTDRMCISSMRPVGCSEGPSDVCQSWAQSQTLSGTAFAQCGYRNGFALCFSGDACRTMPGTPGSEQGAFRAC